MFGWRWFHSVSRRTTSITHWAHVQDCWLCNSRRLSVNSCVISKHSNWIYCRRTTYQAQQESVLWTHPKLASSGWQGETNTAQEWFALVQSYVPMVTYHPAQSSGRAFSNLVSSDAFCDVLGCNKGPMVASCFFSSVKGDIQRSLHIPMLISKGWDIVVSRNRIERGGLAVRVARWVLRR